MDLFGPERGGMACPIQQMTFDEIACYLRGGYANPIQRAIELHTLYCNDCHDAVQEVHSMLRVGSTLVAEAAEPCTAATAPDEATLAAYADDALAADAAAAVSAHLGTCHSCYRQYAAIRQEQRLAPRQGAPLRALQRVRTEAPGDARVAWGRVG